MLHKLYHLRRSLDFTWQFQKQFTPGSPICFNYINFHKYTFSEYKNHAFIQKKVFNKLSSVMDYEASKTKGILLED